MSDLEQHCCTGRSYSVTKIINKIRRHGSPIGMVEAQTAVGVDKNGCDTARRMADEIDAKKGDIRCLAPINERYLVNTHTDDHLEGALVCAAIAIRLNAGRDGWDIDLTDDQLKELIRSSLA